MTACRRIVEGGPTPLLRAALRDPDLVVSRAAARLCAVEMLAALALRGLTDAVVMRVVHSALVESPTLHDRTGSFGVAAETVAAHALARHVELSGVGRRVRVSTQVPVPRSLADVLQLAELSWPTALSTRCGATFRPGFAPADLDVARAVTAAVLEGRWLTALQASWWLVVARQVWCQRFANRIAERAGTVCDDHPDVAFHAAAIGSATRTAAGDRIS